MATNNLNSRTAAAATVGAMQKIPIATSNPRNSSSGPSQAPLRGHQGYEFDSFVSTEEAFFGGIEESKGGGYGALRRLTDKMSNPQEDNTPQMARTRGNLDSFQAAYANNGPKSFSVNRPGMLAMRQQTQRLSPKGASMANAIATQPEDHTPKGNIKQHNQSFKFFDSSQNDSQGSIRLTSERQSNPKLRQNKRSKLKVVTKRESGIIEADTSLKWKNSSSMGNGNLMENYSSDLGEEENKSSSGGIRRSISKRSFVSPDLDRSGEHGRLKKTGRSFRNLQNNKTDISDSAPANVSLPLQRQLHNTESQRIISQPIHHAGQASMKLDMKFGWRPDFQDKDRLHKKEAIAIKLSYPHNPNLCRTSVRSNPTMLSELYRYSKNYRILRTLAKKINEEEFSSRLVYQGYRPSVSLDLHIRYGQKAGFNDESIYYDVLIPKHIKQKAIEEGLGLHSKVPRSPVNQSILATIDQADAPPCDIMFDSMFESGNLDLALQVQRKEFNLYLRPDTNTKGYCNWFFFKVLRRPEGKLPRKKITINIMNMYKKKILFKHEAKPLACSQEIYYKGFVMQELESVQWKTGAFSNIGYGQVSTQTLAQSSQKPNTGDAMLDSFKSQAGAPSNVNLSKKQKFYCLSFDFEFQSGQEFAYIAQSIPYPYTFLKKTIKTCARLDQSMTTLTRSLGGLQMPMLTITNEVVNVSKKRTVIICGRVHPGETNSSWILHGIIDFLISKDASHLRDGLIFKIVPMVNPDGVVAGNYRTSFIGKDLNRLYLQGDAAESKYSNMDEILKPEITAMKQLIKGCKTDDSKGVLAFIDVHQHSQKRGAFMYGPSVSMHHSKYQEVRVLPKLISMMLPDMFRFQSCRFKNQSYKENCARLYCDREQGITFSFCLECSQQGYFTTDPDHGGRRYVKYFDQSQLMFLGRKICEASHMLNEMVEAQDIKREAITKRRRIRNAKKTGKKGCGKSAAGRSAAKGGSRGEQTSMYGGTDFDNESEGYRNLNNSDSSQDMVQGGFNPKIGLKGFIATMMKKVPSKQDLASDSSRGALRTKTNRPLTHFGSEDAVSEKSEKEEESLSEDGSGASSAQDLSEDEQDLVLNQVLDELMPNRIRKMEPMTAQITVTKGLKVEPPILKLTRKNLRSANRIVYIDKKMIQKEQLLMPKAVPDLQVYEASGGVVLKTTQGGQTNFHVTSPPIEHKSSGVVAPFGNDGGLQIGSGKMPDTSDEKLNQNPVLTAARTTTAVKRKVPIQGLNLPGVNSQGYISQNQNKKRILSSRQKKPQTVGKDIFANQNYVPPALKNRQNLASSGYGALASSGAPGSGNVATSSATSKVQYNNIYSVAPTAQPNQTAIQSTFKIIGGNKDSQEGVGTQQNLSHSFSQRQDDITFRIPGIQQINSASVTPSKRRVMQAVVVSQDSTTDAVHTQQFGYKVLRNERTVSSGGKTDVIATQKVVPETKRSINVGLSSPSTGTTPKTRNMSGAVKTVKHCSAIKANRRSIISKRKDERGGVKNVNTVILSSNDEPCNPLVDFQQAQRIDRTKIPLAQGGFFHRNQLFQSQQTQEEQLLGMAANFGRQSVQNSGVVIRHKPGTAACTFQSAKRNSAVTQHIAAAETKKAMNRITHKRQSQQISQYAAIAAINSSGHNNLTQQTQSSDFMDSQRLEQMTQNQFGRYTNFQIESLRKSHAAAFAAQNSTDFSLNCRIQSMDEASTAGQALSGYFLRSPVRTSAANGNLDSSSRHQYAKTLAKTQALIGTSTSVISSSQQPKQKIAKLAFQSNLVKKHHRQRTGKPITSSNPDYYRHPQVNIRAASAQKYNKIGHQSNYLLEQRLQLSPYKQAWSGGQQMLMGTNGDLNQQLLRQYVENETGF